MSYNLYLKGKLNEICDPHFSLFEPAWATDQWVKIFSILVKIAPSYSNFSYCAESVSPEFDTAQSRSRH